MPTLAALLLTVSAVGRTLIAAEAPETDPHFPNQDQVREILAEGVKDYLSGRPKDAAARFNDVVKLDPDSKLLYEFYLAVGDRRMMEMEENDALGDVLKELRRRAWIYQTELRHSNQYITTLMEKMEKGSEEERLVATNELVAVGPMAVPHLLARMSDNRQDTMRVYCRIALTKMGYRAVVPLDEALKAKDERLVESAVMVLGDIADTRSLPKLKQLTEAKGTTDVVHRVIVNALASIARSNAAPIPPPPKKGEKAKPVESTAALADLSADKLYFLEATRYFRDGERVRDEMVSNESLMWQWNEDAAEPAKKLSYVRVPRYAWNELMAEQLLVDGAGSYPQFIAFYPLWAGDLAAQDVEANRRVLIAKNRTSPPQNPDEAMDAIAERVKALEEMHLRVQMFTPDHLYRAVQESIASERYDVAAYLMRQLEDRWLADADRMLPTKEEGLTSDKPGTVLVAALDHGQKTVRYQAAMTLAHLDPALKFFNAEKVVPILADAVGEWGMRVVAVVDQDFRYRNGARDQLQRQGYLVLAVTNGFDLMQRLEETPMKDAIIIAGDLLPTARDEFGAVIDVPENAKDGRVDGLIEKLRKDWRAEKTPIFISLPEDRELAAKIQGALEGKVDGFIQKPFAGAAMEGLIEQVLKAKGQPPNVNRDEAEDISQRAAEALSAIDPTRTQFDVTLAAQALAGTADQRADPVRIAAMRALGNVAQHPKGDGIRGLVTKLTDVYGAQDATLPPPVRAAFLYAIGLLDPSTPAAVQIISKALKDSDPGVRAAAVQAVGHAPKISGEQLYQYQKDHRLNARAQGAGKAAGEVAPAPAAPANGEAQ